jgi:hypothetical protein
MIIGHFVFTTHSQRPLRKAQGYLQFFQQVKTNLNISTPPSVNLSSSTVIAGELTSFIKTTIITIMMVWNLVW